MSFTTVTNRTGPNSSILAEHHNELVEYLQGGRPELVRLVADDAAQYAVTIRNLGAGSRGLLVQDAAGMSLLDVSSSGAVLGFADGSALTPAVRFASDPDSGIYHAADPNEWVLVAGGVPNVQINQGLVWFPTSIRVGSADPEVTTDLRHQLYLNYSGTGTFAIDSPGLSMVDQVLAEVNFAPSNDWDIGAILGVVRNTGGAGKGSMRALAGQLFKYASTRADVDTQSVEVGVHNARAQTSHADNPSTYDAFYGTCGVTILSYGGDIAGGSSNPGVRSNTAILIGSIAGTNSGFKQAVVYYDTDQTTKLWEVTQQGIERLSTQGNAGAPTYSFVTDSDTGMFSGGANVLAFAAGGTERARVYANGFQVAGQVQQTAVLTPPTLTANANDYAPTGLATAAYLYLSLDANRTITGIAAQPVGTVLSVHNGTPFSLTLAHESAASQLLNRFNLPNGADVVLPVMGTLELIYVNGRWRRKA